MRALLLISFCLTLLAATANAQSGTGGISGLVLPEHPDHAGIPGGLRGEEEQQFHPTVVLVPIATHQRIDTLSEAPDEREGRFAFGPVPMGLYLLRVEAPRYETWETEIYIPSDAEAKVYILLHPQRR